MNIVVDGKRYTNFVSAEVTASMDAFARSFSFVAATREGVKDMPFRPGQACEILVDDEKILTGFIERIEYTTDTKGNTYTISGRDKMGDLLDSNLPGLSDAGPTVKATCEKVLKFLGIDARVIDETGEGVKPFESQYDVIAPDASDTAFDFLVSVARRRQVMLTSNGDGDLVIVRGVGNSIDQSIVNRASGEGNNLERVTFIVDHTKRFGSYVVEGQMNLSAIDGTADADSISGSSFRVRDPDGIRSSRVKSISSEGTFSPTYSRDLARWECNVARARSRQYVATVVGFRDRNGLLWRQNTAPIVIDDFAGINSRMLVFGTQYILDDRGQTTILAITDRDAFRVIEEPSSDDLVL